MHILLPTGSATEMIVRKAAEGYDVDIHVTGEIAAFLTPERLETLIKQGNYDCVIVSGMCTASFESVEESTGVPVYRGPRYAEDLSRILPLVGTLPLSRTIPADILIAQQRRERATDLVREREAAATSPFEIRGLKIGGGSRMKVIAEVMDSPKCRDLRGVVEHYFASGADIVDLGLGFDTTAHDVERIFDELEGIDLPLAVDTHNPDLILASLGRVDLILSLNERTIREIGDEVISSGAAAVIVPGEESLTHNLTLAEGMGLRRIIADPLLMPVGSGFVRSLSHFSEIPSRYPLFFGAGNVVELLDADSIGINALLAGIGMELGVSLLFASENSDKTEGCISELRRASEMMVLAQGRSYPKDLGIDLLVVKEKRKRISPIIPWETCIPAEEISDIFISDPSGDITIRITEREIIAVSQGRAIRGSTAEEILKTLIRMGAISRLDHAGYIGSELYKAELALRYGRSFEQDGPF